MKALLIILVLMIGCNKSEDKVTAPPTEADYGVYESCVSDDGLSYKTTVLYNDISLTSFQIYYDGNNCVAGQEMFSYEEMYSYTNVDVEHTLEVESIVMTPLDASVTSAFNSEGLCSSGSWSTNSPMQILGRNCEGEMINRDDTATVTIYKSGTKFVLKNGNVKFSYNRVKSLDLSPAGQTLSNGSYYFYNGTRGVHLTLASPNFTMVIYDQATKSYYTKTGTYTSANNVADLTTTTNTPDCDSDEGTPESRMFLRTTNSLSIESNESTVWMMNKFTNTAAVFRTNYLEAGYSAQCFP